MYGIGKIFDTKYGGLIFSLLAGVAYYIIILDFIMKNTAAGGMLLGLFFAPAIIAGAALIIIKSVRSFSDDGKFKSVNLLIYAHILLIAISIVFLFDLIF